jgi:uncharacterized protein (TIGR03067 family)
MLILAVVIIGCNKTASTGPGDQTPTEESEKVQGSWLLVEASVAGKTVRPPKGEVSIYTFTKDKKLTVRLTGEPDKQGTFKIDPGKTPKHIDLIFEAAEGKEREVGRGIYNIDGDNLTIAMNPDRRGVNRPSALASKTAIIMTLKRQKP